jgi:nucleotide-binding universal stress UspA family protein
MATVATQHLTLDTLVVNPKLARRLPPVLARRYHALPVAEDRGRLTVVMADPEDATARQAILAALGAPPCLVRGDSTAIDALLEAIWTDPNPDSPTLLVCSGDGPDGEALWAYAQTLGGLLGATVHQAAPAGVEALVEDTDRPTHDLIILGGPASGLAERLLFALDKRQVTSPSFLVAQRPRWPLQRILLVIQGGEVDEAAVDWTVRLARESGAAVTVLVVVPPVPAMYRGLTRMQQGLAAVLAADTPLGAQVRQVARRLVDWEIDGTLRLREGAPDWQIHEEVAEGDYDLLVVAAQPQGRWTRRLWGDLVCRLLHCVDRPILIARPTTA